MRWVAPLGLLELVLIAEHHATPVLFSVGLGKPQPLLLVLYSEVGRVGPSEWAQATIMGSSLHCCVANVRDL